MSLLERDRETAVLGDALDRVAKGNGALAAIEGDPGIGKSALLAAARELAEARALGAHLLRASETERSFAYGLVRELVEAILRDADRSARDEPPAVAAQELSELLDPTRETAPAELMVARGLSELLATRAAERPLLIGIDDLHWADLPSLRVLLYAARRISDVAVVLCLTMRPATGTDRAPSQLLDALAAEAGELALAPAALSPSASAALASKRLGEAAEPSFCAACHEATGGNPLLLHELTRALASERINPAAANIEAIARIGGPAVSRTVRLRLAHLPEDATTLARAAAVLGDGTRIAHAATIAGLDPETAFDAAARLVQLEILAGGSQVTFVHPLVREAVLSELSPVEAATLHSSAARMLAERGMPAERVADHLLHSPPGASAETARVLRMAARAAATAGDPSAATKLYARALDEPVPASDRAGVLLELAAAERHTDVEAATVHVRAALELIDRPEERAAAALQLAALLPAIDPRRTIDVMEPHVARLDDPETRIEAQAVMLTGALLAHGEPRRAPELANALRPHLDADTYSARMATSLVGYLDALENRPASEFVAELEAAVAAPLDPPEILGQLAFGMIALVAADSPMAISVADEWKALAAATGFAGQATAALMCRSHVLLARGRLADAIADARAGIEVAELYVGGVAVNWTGAALVDALIETGELEEAEEVVSRMVPTGVPEWTLDLHGLLACRARLAALRTDRASALNRTLDLGGMCEDAGIRNPALAPWRSRAAVLLAGSADGAERARELAGEEVELARAWGAPRALGRALTAMALVGHDAEEVALHTDAVAVLEDSSAPLELARASLGLGVALRRRGKRPAARKPLRRAAVLAEECGATRLLSRAGDELVAAGARPRRTALSGPDSLTPQERRVAAIAAEGLSNKEIAERLYLTPRTVESHLSNAYRKLGIGSRNQLSGALG